VPRPTTILIIGALIGIVIGFTANPVVNTEGHAVCALRSCNPCSPLTIIKECGTPTPTIRNFEHALAYLVVIPAILIGVMLAFRKYYLERKDFYVVR
jgi:hypothetical protein